MKKLTRKQKILLSFILLICGGTIALLIADKNRSSLVNPIRLSQKSQNLVQFRQQKFSEMEATLKDKNYLSSDLLQDWMLLKLTEKNTW